MNCHEFHHLLQRRLDGELVADSPALAVHLEACGECRALDAAARRFEAGMRLVRHPVVTADLTDRIVGRLLARHRTDRRRRLVVQVGFALAASLLLAVLLGVWANRRGKEEAPLLAPQIAHDLSPPAAPAGASSLRESMTEVAQLTIRRADETVRNLLPDPRPNDAASSPLTASVASLREAGSSVSSGLEPVTDSAKRALNLFLREIPPVRTNDKRGS